MKNIFFTISCAALLAGHAFSYVDGTVEVLDSGATTIAVTDSGPVGAGPFTVTVPATSSVWFSIPGYSAQGSSVACHNPCSISINMEYGQVSYWYLPPGGVQSVRNFLPFVPGGPSQPTCGPTSFTVPMMVIGFHGVQAPCTFAVPSGWTATGNMVYIRAQNLRQGLATVTVNGTAHTLSTTPIIAFSCNGTVCAGTTSKPHGLTSGQKAQLNGFNQTQTPNAPSGESGLNAYFTVTVTGATTFTVPSTLVAGNYNYTGFGGIGVWAGKTISATTFYLNETRFWGGIDGNHETVEIGVPLGSTEIVPGQTNTISFGFNQDPNAVTHGWWALDFNVIQSPYTLSQIVTSGTSATATTTASNPFLNGDTVIVWDAPGPRWRFCGKRVITSIVDSSDFTFNWGSDLPGETPGVAPYTTANGTHTVPTPRDATIAAPPLMMAAKALIPYTDFQYYATSQFPSYSGNASNGKTVATTKTLRNLAPYFSGTTSRATCSSCHAHDLGDLHYYAFSTYDIVVAGLMRGLDESDAHDVAAYVESLTPAPPPKGRPWNGLFQPWPGADAAPVFYFDAGGGDEWELTYGEDIPEWLCPGGTCISTPGAPYNLRQVPMAMHLPQWIRWLPENAPVDFYGVAMKTTIPAAITAGTRTVTPVSTLNMIAGTDTRYATSLVIDYGNAAQETVLPSAVTGSTFTAVFANSHNAGATVTHDFTQTPLYTAYNTYLTGSRDSGGLTLPVTLVTATTGCASTLAISGASTIANGDYIEISSATTNGYEYYLVNSGGGTTTLSVSAEQNPYSSNLTPACVNHAIGDTVSDLTAYYNSSNGPFFQYYSAALPEENVKYSIQNQPGVQSGAYAGDLGAGYEYPSQYATMIRDLALWAIAHRWDLMHTFSIENMYDQSKSSSQSGGPNARAGAQSTRGWVAYEGMFNVGPHQDVEGYLNYLSTVPISLQNEQNWYHDTIIWYDVSFVNGAGNMLAVPNGDLDWGYTWLFNGAKSVWRPDFYTLQATWMMQSQQQWGRPTPADMTISTGQEWTSLQLNDGGNNQFSTDAEVANMAEALAVNRVAMIGTFSTAQWKTAIGGFDGGDWQCAVTAPIYSYGYQGVGRWCDAVPFSISVFNYRGVDSTTLAAYIAWANAIWQASTGIDFNTYKTYTCSEQPQGGNGPLRLTCAP